MQQRAASIWECEASQVQVKDGVYSRNGHSLTFKQLAAKIPEHKLDPVVEEPPFRPKARPMDLVPISRMWKLIQKPEKSPSYDTRLFKTPAKRFIQVMSKDKCKVVRCKGLAGR